MGKDFILVSVLFVCLGNICRSPTAEGVFRELVERNGLNHKIKTDSSGTSAWHIDEPPDKRSQTAALKRGINISDLRGRQSTPDDFQKFDYILAMDKSNLSALKRMAPADYTGHLSLFLDFAPDSGYREVPDPYYGGGRGFATVLDLCQQASENLLDHILKNHPD